MTSTGDRVRQARIDAGLSQTALAGDELSPSYISLIESGRREPTDTALAVIAAGLGLTVEFLKHGEEGPLEARARLALDYARLDLESGEAASARDRILAIDLDSVTRRVRVEARIALAQAYEVMGDLETAVSVLEPLLTEALSDRHLLDAADIGTTLTRIYVESGDLGRAVEVGNNVLTQVETGDLIGTDEHLRLGSTVLWAYIERGDMLYASHRATGLIKDAERLGSDRGRGSVYWNAALAAEQRNDYGLAKQYTERALALLSGNEPSRGIPRLRVNYAWLLLRGEQPDPDAALEQLDLAEGPLSVLGVDGELGKIAIERSRAYLAKGDVDAAVRHANAALERMSGQVRLENASAQIALGDAMFAQGDVASAVRAYEWAGDMLGMMAASRQSAAVWRDLGDRFRGQGEMSRAAEAYDRALREAGLRTSVPHTVAGLWTAAGRA